MNPKITPEHLQRGAVVYVRQSTPGQVLEHTESKRRQYALADSARQLGFVSVFVIDDDLGRSGSGLVERPGFQKLVAAICGGSVDYLGPDMFAPVDPDGLAYLPGETLVVFLGQTWADHTEGPIAFVLQPVERFQPLGNLGGAGLDGPSYSVLKRSGRESEDESIPMMHGDQVVLEQP